MSHGPVTFSLGSVAPNALFVRLPFVRGGSPFSGQNVPSCSISLLATGSMRYRHSEENPSIVRFFSALNLAPQSVVSLELIHSRAVYCVSDVSETVGVNGDGLLAISGGPSLFVTVADCMPLYLFDPMSGCFGVLHSGWKGTGIICDALERAQKEYGAKPSDFSVIIGPHINSCCYAVDNERAADFLARFTPECVVYRSDANTGETVPYLSLASANTDLLVRAGVSADNISVCADCTCCSPFFGSFRRQVVQCNPLSSEKESKDFTRMAALITPVSQNKNQQAVK